MTAGLFHGNGTRASAAEPVLGLGKTLQADFSGFIQFSGAAKREFAALSRGLQKSWLLHEEDQGEHSAKISGERLLRFSLRESATHQNLRIETACRLRSFKNIYNAPSDAGRRHI